MAAALVAGVRRPRDRAAGGRGGRPPAPRCSSPRRLVGVLSAGGLVWLAPAVAGHRRSRACARAGAVGDARGGRWSLAGALGVLALPTIVSGALLPPTSSPLTDAGARGNLVEPLEPAQAAGIWPAGDFRFDPDAELAAYA